MKQAKEEKRDGFEEICIVVQKLEPSLSLPDMIIIDTVDKNSTKNAQKMYILY